MRDILVHFNRKFLGLSYFVRNTHNSDKLDPNYARLSVFIPIFVLSYWLVFYFLRGCMFVSFVLNRCSLNPLAMSDTT